jgi:predicted metal-dependent phosphoesterase TrpH
MASNPVVCKCDLHVHSQASRDSRSTCEQIVRAARRRGLDRVAITDHNSIAGALKARELAPELIIVGEEIATSAGEVIALFLSEPVPRGLTPTETVRRVHAQGGIAGVSHPMENFRREAMREEALLELIGELDFLEVFNARVLDMRVNQRAARLAQERGLPGSSGSDAHTPGEIGRAWVEIPPFTNAAEFLVALRAGQVRGKLSSPLVHLLSTYNKLLRKMSGRQT